MDMLQFAFLIVLNAVILLAAAWLLLRRLESDRASIEAERAAQAQAMEAHLSELKGRIAQMTENTTVAQSSLARTLNEQLDRVSLNLNRAVAETRRDTAENLTKLSERLAVIDTAQKNITELSGRVVSLQDILANKQTRGAFGQVRMETIIQDGLPAGSFTFQATLSNGKRPDCLIHLPNNSSAVVIDAKFPLEGFEALRAAKDESQRKDAMRRVRADVSKHLDDMAARYFIAGETQDTALLFVPAESLYAELHESFPDLIQKAHRSRIVIVSPNMLMLAVQTMMAIMKDVRMREQATVIQREVHHLLDDVRRLADRAADLKKHFNQLLPDVDKIMTSTEKIDRRAEKIKNLEIETKTDAPAGADAAASLIAAAE